MNRNVCYVLIVVAVGVFIVISWTKILGYYAKIDDNLAIELDDGTVVGSRRLAFNGEWYYSFRGIPYARPPIGHLRFQPPEPNDPWNGTLLAIDETRSCPQNDRNLAESEDCLLVNVFMKHKPDPSNLKPVMFFIYGGGFCNGWSNTSTYGPDHLVVRDIIIVSFNYRLGLLGFLKLNDPRLKMFGNNGFKDQRLALRWVRKNIARFGGDPERVTLVGNSAGAMSVHAHLLSKSSRGLFRQAIIQSGVMIYNNISVDVHGFARFLNRKLGFELETEEDALRVFNASTGGEMLVAAERYSMKGYFALGLVVEHPQSPDPFLTETPVEIIRKREFNDVPCIIGYLNTEGIERVSYFNKTRDQWFFLREETLDYMLGKRLTQDERDKYKGKLFDFYFSQPNKPPLYQFFDLQSDIHFIIPTNDVIQRQMKRQESAVYVYRFGVDTRLNLGKRRSLWLKGAGHADELGYLFYQSYNYPENLTEVERRMIDRMVTMWTNFIRSGDPNKPELRDHVWSPIDHNGTKVRNLLIENEVRMVEDYEERGRVDFWRKLRRSRRM